MGSMLRSCLALRPFAAFVVLAVLALSPAPAAAAAQVSGFRVGIHPDGVTRFVMDLSQGIAFRVRPQADPNRLVIETGPLDWQAERAMAKAVGSVGRLAIEAERVILDLREPALVKTAFVIAPRDGQGWRFVMDLNKASREAFHAAAHTAAREVKPPPAKVEPAVASPPPAPSPLPAVAAVHETPAPAGRIVLSSPDAAPPAPEPRVEKGGKMLTATIPPLAGPPVAAPEPPPPPVTKVAAPAPMVMSPPLPEPQGQKSDGRPVVVIDPGHGGVDPGAIGISGVYEKYITLAVARELKTQLEQTGHYKVFLTRDRDVFIRLRDRIAYARQQGADLFVSLHADAVQSPSIRGLSIYTLSQTASDTEAGQLADKENKADLIAGIDLSHESADVANILIDLTQRETMNRSAGFAGDIVEELGRDTALLANTHRFAGFAVLKAPDVPSVLIELGYLSHEAEERQLRQPDYRIRLAKAITRSVERFFLQGQKARRP
ncbi:MAG: N-acetylmuramoyl-L-alanine amidase [Magnetospirillum sp.]|nr:N-acetylmuramoyl-L-alanine amidase [Magnetospirillum sp.]